MFAGQCRRDFEPDADLEKSDWKNAIPVSLGPQGRFPDAKTEVAALWSKSFVYFAFRSNYTELNMFEGKDGSVQTWGLWNRDVVEVFINPFPDRINQYWEFEVAPNNLWIDLAIDLDKDPFHDSGWYSGFQHATRIETRLARWDCEMRIPVSSMDVGEVLPGTEWRINFFRCDGLGDDSKRRFLAWIPTLDESFHVPSRFGLIRFVESMQGLSGKGMQPGSFGFS
jgi:alpha-galactosidase